MRTFLFTLTLLLSTLRLVRCHGFVKSVTVAGQTYPAWDPNLDPYHPTAPKVVRKVMDDGPTTPAAKAPVTADVACNRGGDVGTAATAKAPAGSEVFIQWNSFASDHHGPVTTYMANCGKDCATFSANSARWFKVEEAGYDKTTKLWGSDRLMAAGDSWTSRIPANLAPGKYLFRHEIIALHSSFDPQHYPSCIQIEVTGNGTGVPEESELVNLLDVYRDKMAFTDIWETNFVAKDTPGPRIASLVGNRGGSNPPPPPNAPVPTPTPTTTPAPPRPTSTGRTCGKNKQSKRSKHAKRRMISSF